ESNISKSTSRSKSVNNCNRTIYIATNNLALPIGRAWIVKSLVLGYSTTKSAIVQTIIF
ncbi:22587_t:CDS:2, partial [Entrophospora sp. SA101]